MRVLLFGVGLASKTPNVSAQKRVNCHLEFRPEDDKTRIVAGGMHGLDVWSATGLAAPARGGLEFGDYLYVVFGDSLRRFYYGDGVMSSSLGSLNTSSGKVGMSHNGTQITIVDGTYGYTYTPSTGTFAQITDPHFPGGDTTWFLDGRTFVNDPNTGAFYGSSAYDSTAWSATDFATAESSPDNLVAGCEDRGGHVLLGESNTEFWQNIGGSGFPYAITGGANAEYGLGARWSLAPWENGRIALVRNKLGQLQVAALVGFAWNVVSDNDLDKEINGYTVTSDAVGFSYRIGGHPFYQLNFPTAERSWLFDGSTGQWSIRRSWGMNRHRVEMGFSLKGMTIMSHFANGTLYVPNLETYAEAGEILEYEIVSRHQFSGTDYENLPISELVLDFERGVGLQTGQGSDPKVMLTISKDGGHTWGNEIQLTLGAVGKYLARCVARRLGTARNGDWTFKLRITDPVKRVLLGASIQ